VCDHLCCGADTEVLASMLVAERKTIDHDECKHAYLVQIKIKCGMPSNSCDHVWKMLKVGIARIITKKD